MKIAIQHPFCAAILPPTRDTLLTLAALVVSMPVSAALEINETLTGKSSSYDWQSLGGACLTAGDSTKSSTIPPCNGLPYYRNADQVGGDTGKMPDVDSKGALRLTNGTRNNNLNISNDQSGAVYSKFKFPSNEGVDITFKTVTYGGNGFENSGGDGIAFFLTDADQVSKVDASTTLGVFGGSLGYSCSNQSTKSIVDGLYGAYMAVGIDEFGNFANRKDNTHQGANVLQQNYVTIKGAGNTNWRWLNANYPQYYPGKLLNNTKVQQDAVRRTCLTGKLQDYSRGISRPVQAPTPVDFLNYPIIESQSLGLSIQNQQRTALPRRDRAVAISYNIKITQNSLLSFSYSYDGGRETPLIKERDISKNNGPMPKAFHFGFSASTGAASNVHEIMCFKAAKISGSASSAAGNIPPEGRVQEDTHLYLASFHPRNWWGQLEAKRLLVNDKDHKVSIQNTATWDASCVLTGGICPSTDSKVNAPAQTNRRLLTWNDNEGSLFSFDHLSAAQKQALGADQNTRLAQQYVAYLSGDRAQEITSAGSGVFRKRDSLLGDIYGSSPTWVGAPRYLYSEPWKDKLHGNQKAPEPQDSYKDFQSAHARRPHVVYVGANDGFLHGFRSGSSTASGKFDNTNNDGREVLGYIPSQAVKTIGNPSDTSTLATQLNYGSPHYAHNTFVDATPGVGDLYVNGQWRTWLAGGMGAGGNVNTGGDAADVIADPTRIGTGTLFVLDITDPANFSTSQPSQMVVGEWTSRTLRCVNDTVSFCGDHLGNTYGTPLIRRLHNGQWGVIFPNGKNSKSGKSGIFVMTIDPRSGQKAFRFLAAGEPQRSGQNILSRNGITQVTAVDLDEDHISDYVYAGDMHGNVWRFDLTAESPDDWKSDGTPLFVAPQPITTAVRAIVISKRVLLSFATGQLHPQTLSSPATPVKGPHRIYGIWDARMTRWNSKIGKDGAPLQSLEGDRTITSSELVAQTLQSLSFTNEGQGISGARTISKNPVCWKGSSTCNDNNNAMGWFVELPGDNEQVIYNMVLRGTYLVVNTTIPEVAQPLSCGIRLASGFTLALRADSGSTGNSDYFVNIDNDTNKVFAGIGLSGVGAPMFVTLPASGSDEERTFMITQTVSGVPRVVEVMPKTKGGGGDDITGQRVNWVRKR